jgi:hypothetical protein
VAYSYAVTMTHVYEQGLAGISPKLCPGWPDRTDGRAALLSDLLRPSLSSDLRQACLEGLAAQICEAVEPSTRALRRWLILDVASEAARSSEPIAQAVLAAVSTPAESSECLVTSNAFELVPSVLHRQYEDSAAFTEVVTPQSAPVPGWIRDLVDANDYARAGQGWEEKYRLVSVSRCDHGGLRLSVAQTTWEEGAAFHTAMSRQLPLLRNNTDAIISAWLAKTAHIPGILSVHCILITRDRKLVGTRRGASSFYSASRWSFSFEEQLTASDFETTEHDALATAARRGLTEEFDLPADGCHVRMISVLIELPIINPIVVAVIETPATSETIRRKVDAGRDEHEAEIEEVTFVDLIPDQLAAEMRRNDLHPTSEMRLLLLSRAVMNATFP